MRTDNKPDIEPVAFDVAAAAKAAHVGRNTIYTAMNTGNLRAKKLGRRTVVLRDDLMAWISALPEFKSREAA